MLARTVFAAVGLGIAVSARAIEANEETLPTVDLGYSIHEASVNRTGDYFAFKNIRYADPPVGDHRFQPAAGVTIQDQNVNNGSVGVQCPQAYPKWALEPTAAAEGVSAEYPLEIVLSDPTITEDCLFLDIVVPRTVFEMDTGSSEGAPVMVWIFGGGFIYGDKDDATYDPSGLIARSQADGSDGVIFVSLNYRLGLFGWLNGAGDEAILPNVGLQDQRLALEWVQKYIHLFGGCPDRVTLFGESAGAGSIMHHITAEGGHDPAPFQSALLQSPGWSTTIDIEAIWATTLAVASNISGESITCGSELAALDSSTLMRINAAIVFDSPLGSFVFGPTVDGGYVPDLPGVLLLEGKFNRGVTLMLGHNSHEGSAFVTQSVNNEAVFMAGVTEVLQGVDKETISFVLTKLYPPASETDVYDNNYGRLVLLVSEITFVCNTRYLSTAFGNATWNYRFQVPPGTHAQDVPWTFYRGNTTNVDPALAEAMQVYFTKFGEQANPNNAELPNWPLYGDDAHITTFGLDGIGAAIDDAKNERCAYWQAGKYRG